MDDPIAKRIMKEVKADPGSRMGELVDRLTRDQGVRRHEVARQVYRLWKEEGKLTLEDPAPPSTLCGYFKSFYSLWFWVMIAVVTATLSVIYLLPQTIPYTYARYVLGSLFILYVPGSSLIECLYPKEEDLGPLLRLALSVGLSFAIVPLVGLVLNYTPWGTKLDSILASLSLATTAFSAIGVGRKFAYSRENRLSSQ